MVSKNKQRGIVVRRKGTSEVESFHIGNLITTKRNYQQISKNTNHRVEICCIQREKCLSLNFYLLIYNIDLRIIKYCMLKI